MPRRTPGCTGPQNAWSIRYLVPHINPPYQTHCLYLIHFVEQSLQPGRVYGRPQSHMGANEAHHPQTSNQSLLSDDTADRLELNLKQNQAENTKTCKRNSVTLARGKWKEYPATTLTHMQVILLRRNDTLLGAVKKPYQPHRNQLNSSNLPHGSSTRLFVNEQVRILGLDWRPGNG